jgi:flagellar basal-body rod protein FlgB
MLSNMFNSTTIPVLQEAVGFAQARHTALAGNIANLDTPGYKFRDLSVEDFQAQLKEAIEDRDRIAIYRASDPSAFPASPRLAKVADQPHTILYHDKSNVELEQQVTEMVNNQMQHNLALSIMNNQFRLLQAAISERV